MQTNNQVNLHPLTPQQLAAINQDFNNRPLPEIPEEELLFYVPMDDLTLDELTPLNRWGRMAHSIMLENLRLLVAISRSGPQAYRTLLEGINSRYKEREYDLQAQWKVNNPAQPEENLAAWHNQAMLAAREMLTAELVQELGISNQ